MQIKKKRSKKTIFCYLFWVTIKLIRKLDNIIWKSQHYFTYPVQFKASFWPLLILCLKRNLNVAIQLVFKDRMEGHFQKNSYKWKQFSISLYIHITHILSTVRKHVILHSLFIPCPIKITHCMFVLSDTKIIACEMPWSYCKDMKPPDNKPHNNHCQ